MVDFTGSIYTFGDIIISLLLHITPFPMRNTT